MITNELIAKVRGEVARGASHEEIGRALDQLAAALEEERSGRRSKAAATMELARSASLGDGRLDVALQEITERASDVLGVARSSVWTYDADQTSIRCIDLFVRREGSHESGIVLPAATYPGYFRALREERIIPAHDAHTDPRTSEFSAGYLAPLGIGAMLDAPIRLGGRMIGVLCNEHVGPKRTWTADEEQFAASLADFVALAMESSKRRETEEQLRAMVQMLEDGAKG